MAIFTGASKNRASKTSTIKSEAIRTVRNGDVVRIPGSRSARAAGNRGTIGSGNGGGSSRPTGRSNW